MMLTCKFFPSIKSKPETKKDFLFWRLNVSRLVKKIKYTRKIYDIKYNKITFKQNVIF